MWFSMGAHNADIWGLNTLNSLCSVYLTSFGNFIVLDNHDVCLLSSLKLLIINFVFTVFKGFL